MTVCRHDRGLPHEVTLLLLIGKLNPILLVPQPLVCAFEIQVNPLCQLLYFWALPFAGVGHGEKLFELRLLLIRLLSLLKSLARRLGHWYLFDSHFFNFRLLFDFERQLFHASYLLVGG